jgi:hypothetical protein
MNITNQGPEIGIKKKAAEVVTVTIQGICFDGEFIRLEGEPVGLAIRQEVFAKWLNVTHYSMYVAGLDTFGGNSFDWYFATFENSFTTKKIQKTIKQYIESQTTFQINYE